MDRRRFEQLVYSMKQFRGFKTTEMPADREFGDAGDDGPDDGEDGRQVDDVEVDEPPAHEPAGWGQLLRGYYGEAFADGVGQFNSVMVDNMEGGREQRCFQLLAFKPVLSLLKSHRARTRYTCRLNMQWLEPWRARDTDTAPQMDMFEASDPDKMDVGSFVRYADQMEQVWQWSELPSDVQGRVSLHQPRQLQVLRNLSHRKVPVLCLIDAMKEDGCTLIDEVCVHEPMVQCGQRPTACMH